MVLTSLKAQPPGENTSAWIGIGIEAPAKAYVFADQCNLREKPDVNARVLEKLFIGTEVEVLEVLKTEFSMRGVSAPWLRIKAKGKQGYVWMGNLTTGVLKLEKGELALVGITAKQQVGENSKYFASVRIAKGEIMKCIKEFEVIHADHPTEGWLERLPHPDLTGVECVLVYQTESGACGVFGSEHHLLYTGTDLFFVGSGYGMGDGGMLHSTKTYRYPINGIKEEWLQAYKQPYPNQNTIIREVEDGEYNEECTYVTVIKTTRFTWDGKELNKACDY